MIKKIIKNESLLNVISNLILQFVTIISGFILPRLVLSTFGSEINGLTSSLGQLLNCIALLEGGVTGVVMANLYKPLVNKDFKALSSVIVTTKKFYKKIGIIFIGYAFVLALIYPIIFHVNFSYMYVFSLTLILAIQLFMQYNFSLTYKTLLNADKKIYIVSISQTILIIFNIFLAIFSIKIYPSIHLFKLATAIMYILQPLIYKYFVDKYYRIDKNAEINKVLLKSRWDGLAINIAYFIHSNTDVVVLTMFSDLKTISIYSVYKMVTNGINQLISAIGSAISPTIGHIYASDNKEELNSKFNLYEFLIFFITFLLFSVTGLLIVPFVMIYTKNITDTNYFQPIFAIILLLAEAMYVLKTPHVNLAYSANKFKEISKPAYIEAALNIVVSLILVQKFGLVGVAIGTLIAMTYRTMFQVWFLKKNILNRPFRIFMKKFLIFGLITIVGSLFCVFVIPQIQYTILNWIIHAIIYFTVMSILYIIISYIFYRNELIRILNTVFKK